MDGETNPNPFSSKNRCGAFSLYVQNIFWCNASGLLPFDGCDALEKQARNAYAQKVWFI